MTNSSPNTRADGSSTPTSRAIDYPFTPQQRHVQEQVRAFAQEKLAPIADEVDVSDEHSDQLVELMHESGLFAHFVPEELGGAGLSVTNICIVREELARTCIHADEWYAAQGLAVQSFAKWGDDEMKRTYLTSLLDGTRRFTFCLTEPGAGSDVGGIESTATPDGDHFLINGTKRFIYSPDACTTLLVFAKTDPELGRRGISAFVLDRPDEGIEITPYHLLSPSPHTEITFHNVPVPAANIVGPRGGGVRVALSNLDRLRPSVGAAAIGMAERHSPRRSPAHAEPQGIRRADLGLPERPLPGRGRGGTGRGADARLRGGGQRRRRGCQRRRRLAKAKLFATETAQEVIDLAVQLHGEGSDCAAA